MTATDNSVSETLDLNNSGGEIENITISKALRNYYEKAFKFKQKNSRKEYFVGVVYQWIMSVLFVGLTFMGLAMISDNPSSAEKWGFSIFQWGWWLAIYLPSFALTFRRSYGAVGKAWVAILYYVGFILSMFFYTAAIALAAFSAEFVAYFYVSALCAVVFSLLGFGSWLVLLFKKSID